MAGNPKEKQLCFVVGPIGNETSETRIHADWLLEEIIQPVMETFPDFVVKRADQDHRPGLIDAQLINDLLNADLVIADLSGLNPNAFYEIGIRHMAQKPIIHMQLADENIPFDVSLYRSIKFSRVRPRDIKSAREVLKAQVEATRSKDYQVENPITNARGRLKLEEHATGEQKVVLRQLESIQERLSNLESGQPKALAGVVSHRWSIKARVIDDLSDEAFRNLAFQVHDAGASDVVYRREENILEATFSSTVRGSERVLRRIASIKGIIGTQGPDLISTS